MNDRTRYVNPLIMITSALVGLLLLLLPNVAQAGIYDASSPVTYKEYWVPHSEFPGGCGTSEPADWYFEPRAGDCERTLNFEIPDNFNSALKAEIYIDLWRNHDARAVRFRLNSGQLRAPNVGSDWSRTPYLAEIPLSELKQGTNTIFFTNDGSSRLAHVHDIAIRIYYDAAHPLVPGGGSDVIPPTGSLTSIQASNGTFSPNAGSVLVVDDDQITLSAVVTGANMIEFHAFYEGYDLDNDGVFREWHNRGRLNCHPGGSTSSSGCSGAIPAVGGTIDHIGTTGPAGTFSNCSWNGGTNTAICTWDLRYVTNQSGVRFKIRAIDAAGNVIDAAGGDSANFTLFRNNPTAAFLNPEFKDAVLHHNGDPGYSDFYTATVNLPSNVSSYDTAYLLGSYWRNPRITINSRTLPEKNGRAFVQGSTAPEDDTWTLSKVEIPGGRLSDGVNYVQYAYGNSFGEFIEKPGPMIMLRRTGAGFVDSTAPAVTEFTPADGRVDVDPDEPIIFNLEDDFGVGVDYTSIQLRVNGNLVSPKISGFSNRYNVSYSPAGGFPTSTPFAVTINAKDLAGNVLQTTYNFTTEPPDVTPPVISEGAIQFGGEFLKREKKSDTRGKRE